MYGNRAYLPISAQKYKPRQDLRMLAGFFVAIWLATGKANPATWKGYRTNEPFLEISSAAQTLTAAK